MFLSIPEYFNSFPGNSWLFMNVILGISRYSMDTLEYRRIAKDTVESFSNVPSTSAHSKTPLEYLNTPG